MDLLLVRHAQPDWAPDQIARNDPSLTEVGREQARRVAHRLVGLDHVDEIWVSPMRRALETVEPIVAELGIEPEVHDWLEEIRNPPEWDGTPVEQVDRILADASQRSMDEMWDGLPGGESFREFHNRVVTGFAATLDTHGIHPVDPTHRHLWTVDDPGKRVVIVGHAGSNNIVLGHLLGLEPVPWEWERFRQPHTGVARLITVEISTAWTFSLRQSGSVSHLHPGMVTL